VLLIVAPREFNPLPLALPSDLFVRVYLVAVRRHRLVRGEKSHGSRR